MRKCPHCEEELPGELQTTCPRCLTPLGKRDREGRRQPVAPEAPSEPEQRGALAKVLGTALYGVSLPERLVRSVAAGLGGAVKQITDAAVPDLVKRTTVYTILIERLLQFVIEHVGQVEGQYDSATKQDQFVVRKVLGNFLELAGFAAIRVSPLWLLALVGDGAYGIRTYLDLLVRELKAKGMIDPAETIGSGGELLTHLERLTSTAASATDLPPTTVAELKRLWQDVRQEAADTGRDAKAFRAQAERLLRPMRDVAQQERVSLLELSSLLAMRAGQSVAHPVSTARQAGQVATAAAVAGGRLFDEEVVKYYARQLTEIQQRGFYQTLLESYKPYVSTVVQHFKPERDTLTRQLLSGEFFARLRSARAGK